MGYKFTRWSGECCHADDIEHLYVQLGEKAQILVDELVDAGRSREDAVCESARRSFLDFETEERSSRPSRGETR